MGVLPRSHSLVLVSLHPKPTIAEAIAPNALQQIPIERAQPKSQLLAPLCSQQIQSEKQGRIGNKDIAPCPFSAAEIEAHPQKDRQKRKTHEIQAPGTQLLCALLRTKTKLSHPSCSFLVAAAAQSVTENHKKEEDRKAKTQNALRALLLLPCHTLHSRLSRPAATKLPA